MIDSMTSSTALAPVNLIIGGEEFLVERHRRKILQQARVASGNPHLPLDVRACSDINEAELMELLSPSLFADDRAIVITGVESAGKETITLLEQAIRDPAPGVVLIMTHKGGGRNKKLTTTWPKLGAIIHHAAELKRPEKLGFIDQEFRSYDVRVSPDVIRLVFEVIGSDLRELASAVSQLVADTDGKVDDHAVKTYYQGKAEVSGFDIADATIAGNVRLALALTRRALQLGTPAVLLVSALSSAVGDISRVAGAGRIDPRRDAQVFGMAPWKLEKTIRVARQWTPRTVAAAVQIVAELDAGVKGKSANPNYAVEDAVRRLAMLNART